MIIGVIRRSGVQSAELAAKKRLTVAVYLGSFVRVTPNCPVSFMKKPFAVPSRPSRETRHVEHFGGSGG